MKIKNVLKYLQHQESGTRTLITAVITITIWTFTAYAT